MVASLAIFAALSSVLQLHLLQFAMKYYDQLEAMPIYQTAIMIMWIVSGLIIFRETRYYTWGQLWCIFFAIVVCCIGIKFLTSKKT